jgi:hypothetical protein
MCYALPAAIAGESAAPNALPSDPTNGARTLLLVDDHEVLYRAGTKRIFHPLKRHPANPVIKGKQKPWEIAIAFNSVYRDATTGHYKMWYQSFAGEVAKERANRCTVCYAESTDGVVWTKPELGLFPFNGVQGTNIVLQANGGTSDRYGASVLFDPRDANPARRYKMAYFDFTRDTSGRYRPGLSVAFSSDGIRWSKYVHAGPLLDVSYGDYGDIVPFSDQPDKGTWVPLSIADAVDATYDPVHQCFALYGKMWLDGPDGRMYWKHAAHRTVSKDFIHWEKPVLCIAPDDEDPPYVEFHTTPTFYHEGVYIAAPQILRRAQEGGVMDVELAVSRDGLNFSRPFRKDYWLPRGPKNAFDGGTVLTNATPIVLDDEIRIYYGGYSGGATGGDDYSFSSGVGLATMPRDRFAGVRPADEKGPSGTGGPPGRVGQITFKPQDLADVERITVNADASRGSVAAELLDINAYRVRGFTSEDARPLTRDSLRHELTWKTKTLAQLGGDRRCHLRLHLRGEAEVFAVTLHREAGQKPSPAGT